MATDIHLPRRVPLSLLLPVYLPPNQFSRKEWVDGLGLLSWKRPLLWLPLLVVAACGIVAAVGFAPGPDPASASPQQAWERIAARMHRPIRGRLGADFLHRRCPDEAALCGPLPSLSSPEFRQLSALLARLSNQPTLDPASLHIGALASLIIDGPASIETMERMAAAAALAPKSISIRSDLIAARLAFGVVNRGGGGDPSAGAQQELQAMREIVRLAAEAPDDPAVWFNYALTLEAVGLPRPAEDAWRRFLELEPEGEWAEEARQHLATRAESPVAPSDPPEDPDALEEWAAAHPLEARRHVERVLLSKWAEAEGTAEGERALRSLEVVASIVASRFGDYIFRDTVEHLRRVSNSERLLLADAVDSYQEGVMLISEQRFTEALARFAAIRETFSRSELSLLHWVEYRIAVSLYGLDRFNDARAVLRAMDVDRSRQQVLESRRLWLLALVEGALGRLHHSVMLSEQALDILVQHQDFAAVASIHINVAGPLDQFSQTGRAWMHRLQGLRASSRLSDYRLRHIAYMDAAEELIEMGDVEPALPFLFEFVRNAEEWGLATARLEARLLHASALSMSGRHQQAAEELEHAGKAAGELEDPDRVLRLSADIAVEQAENILATDPNRALGKLERALKIYHNFGYSYPLVRLHRLRGLAARRLGRVDRAGEAYRAAVAAHEAVLATLESPEHRGGYLVEAGDAYDSLIHHVALEEGDAEEAFRVLERSRSSSPRGPVSRVIGLRDMQATLSEDMALIAYRVLADEVLAWWVTAREIEVVAIPVERSEIVRNVAMHVTEVALSSGGFGQDSATVALYQRLIAPFDRRLARMRRLAVIPDRLLRQVAFSALVDGQTGRYIIDSLRSLTVLPSASGVVGQIARTSSGGILVIGDPAFDPQQFPALKRLPAAAQEAIEVAALYQDSVLLVGKEARRSRIQQELRGRRILHYAGHAIVDPRDPERGALLLAPEPRNDGLLTVQEWKELSFSGLDLVVLSSCQTAGAEETVRHDWVGALLSGGVRGVVASRWEVDDEMGRRFLIRFHELLTTGLSSPEALLATQKSLRAEPPRMWAGFSYYGATNRTQEPQ